MLGVFILLLKEDWRKRFPSPFALAGEALGLGLSLVIYWYTSRAFGTAGMSAYLGGLATDYCSYIVLSEATLIVPIALMHAVLEFARQAREEGTLDEYQLLPENPALLALCFSSVAIPRELFRATLTLVVASLFFGFQLALKSLSGWLLIQAVSLPVFAGIGMIAAAFFLIYGRGQGVLSLLAIAGTILGGAYFPQSLLPEFAQKVSHLISPFQLLLQAPRQLFLEGWTGDTTRCVAGLLGWGAALFTLGAFALSHSLNQIRQRGSSDVYYFR